MESAKQFVHLHLHSDHSLLDGAIKIGPLAARAAELKMPAVALTDHGNLSGALGFYHQMRGAGVKPIIGIEAYIARGSRHDRGQATLPSGERATNHLVLLAKDLKGYHNLVKLSSLSYLEGFWRKPRIDRELLAQHSEGLIGLSACISGVPPTLLLRDRFDDAAKAALEFEQILGKGNYYLEIQEHGLDAQKRIRKPLVELSKKTGIPLVATNDSHYLMQTDVRAHDVLLCIGTGKTINDPNRLTYGSPNYYFRSAEEMWETFGEEPQLLQRTLEIAEKCDLEFPKMIDQLPVYPVPEGFTAGSYFKKVAHDGFEARRKEIWQPLVDSGSLKNSLTAYHQRLALEIETIERMGFAGYFLIVWDFIRYAREKGIPVGPGRGSAAGSLVAFCMRITDLDPLQYDLLFERFLNPERVTMPDIDVDFCVRGRGEVINYVSEFYGRQNVSQIITFGTLASRAVIKDVGRALDMPYAEVEKVAKLVPPPVRGRNVSIDDALKQSPELRNLIETNDKIKDLIETARRLEGCARHASVHAAGVVISPQPIYEFVPICRTQNEEVTTQYVMSDLEKTGLLKMDFLALTTLTIIEDCLSSIERETGSRPDLARIPLDDQKTLRLFADGLLKAVFQFESSGMVEICRKLRPEGLEDLSALNALYRPGPIDGGMVDDYIERRHGKRSVKYIVPEMKEILENTYGILVYQEQIMQLAQRLSGYSLGEADTMRRAMGKKKKAEMAMHEARFVRGAVERGIAEEKAQRIFTLMAQFADYGFNRSHSFAYAYLAYQTAYLKAHYPAHFFAAVLTNESASAEKVGRYIGEMRHFGIALMPPDVNSSHDGFTPVGPAIRYGLGAIKGIGSNAVSAIAEAREQGGGFSSIFDFTERVDSRSVNKRVVELLIKAGAFDSVSPERARLLATLDRAFEHGARVQRDQASGQAGLFGELLGSSAAAEPHFLVDAEPLTRQQMLAHEKEALGFYATGHPLEDFEETIAALSNIDSGRIASGTHGDTVAMGGLVSEIATRITKKGDRFAIFRLADRFGDVKIVCWPEQFARFQPSIENEKPVLIKGRLELDDDGSGTIVVQEIQSLERALERAARLVVLKLASENLTQSEVTALADLLQRSRGDVRIEMELGLEEDVVRLRLSEAFRVSASSELVRKIRELSPEV